MYDVRTSPEFEFTKPAVLNSLNLELLLICMLLAFEDAIVPVLLDAKPFTSPWASIVNVSRVISW